VSARQAPALHVWLELEQPGQLILAADTYEDELRLRSWLRRSRALEALPEILARLLGDLDAFDAERAA
jgi:hypothetical protein